MEKISAAKVMKIIEIYLDGKSIREIASLTGVAVGTVANVINALKKGKLPQVREPFEQVQMARELKADLRAMGRSLEEAALGAALLHRLLEEGIETADLNPCLDFWRRMAAEGDGRDLANAAFRLDDACQRTGLGPDALVERVGSLEKEVSRLEAARQELEPAEKALQQTQERRASLSAEVQQLDEETVRRQQNVNRLEKREEALARRVTDWEKRAADAEERLAIAQRGRTQLAQIGLPPDELAGLAQQLAAVARRHGWKPAALRERLLDELSQLAKGLGLDRQVKAKRSELRGLMRAIQTETETRDRLRSEIAELRRQLATVRGQMAADRAVQERGLQSYVSDLKAAGEYTRQALSSTSSEMAAEMQKVKDQAFEVGREIGQYESTIQQNQPVATLATLLSSQDEVKPQDVQFVSLLVLRRLRDWGKKQECLTAGLHLFLMHLDSVITDLEGWRP